jgi:hypothetical protein
MKIFYTLIIFSLVVISSNSRAEIKPYSFEITPIYGYRNGGSVDDENDVNNQNNSTKHNINDTEMYGVIISLPYERGKTLELYYSHQSTHVDSINITEGSTTRTDKIPFTIDYLHIGGTAPISEDEKLQTFVTGGLGFAYLNPKYKNTNSELRPSLSIGIGLKWPLTDYLAFRLETRGLGTFFNNNSTLFCNGGCSLSASGNAFFQIEVFSGMAFKF